MATPVGSARVSRLRHLRRRPGWLALLSVLFLVVPVLEVWVILKVGQQIGGWQTLLLLIFWSALGAWLVRREGRNAWRGLSTALRTGRMPSRELADAGLVLVGGALLLAPGFITDAFGLLLILPFTRPVARGLVQRVVERRLLAPAVDGMVSRATGGLVGDAGQAWGAAPPRQTWMRGSGEVIDGVVVQDSDAEGSADSRPGAPSR